MGIDDKIETPELDKMKRAQPDRKMHEQGDTVSGNEED